MGYTLPGIPGPHIGWVIAGAGGEGVVRQSATQFESQLVLAELCTHNKTQQLELYKLKSTSAVAELELPEPPGAALTGRLRLHMSLLVFML